MKCRMLWLGTGSALLMFAGCSSTPSSGSHPTGSSASVTFGQPVLAPAITIDSTPSPNSQSISILTENSRLELLGATTSGARVVDIRVPVTFHSPGSATINLQIRGATATEQGATVELWSLGDSHRLIRRWRNTNETFVLPYSQTVHADASRVVAAGPAPTEEIRVTLLLRATRPTGDGIAFLELDSFDAAAPQP